MERTKPPTPAAVGDRVKALGARIRAARGHRRWRRVDLAERAGVSRTTVEAIERGDLATSIGAYVRALWVMGLDKELELVADPGLDREGLALEFSMQNKRVRVGKGLTNEF